MCMISLHQRLWGLWSPPTTDFAGKGTNNVMEIKLTEIIKRRKFLLSFYQLIIRQIRKG